MEKMIMPLLMTIYSKYCVANAGYIVHTTTPRFEINGYRELSTETL